MSEIKFGDYSRKYENFYIIFHICAAAICVIMAVYFLFGDNGTICLPPIFLIGMMQCIVNAYDCTRGVRKSKIKSRHFAFCISLGIAFLILTVFAIGSFWL